MPGALVGERGLEPPTRSTQSYASGEALGVGKPDNGGGGANAYPGASHEDPEIDLPDDVLNLPGKLDLALTWAGAEPWVQVWGRADCSASGLS